MERITTTIEDHTLAAIREIAGPRGVSAFLQAAAEERLARLQILGLLDDLEAQHGAAPASVRRAIAEDAGRVFGIGRRRKR